MENSNIFQNIIKNFYYLNYLYLSIIRYIIIIYIRLKNIKSKEKNFSEKKKMKEIFEVIGRVFEGRKKY